MKFPDVTKPVTLEKHYYSSMGKKELNLMQGLLNMDPRSRLTAFEDIQHPYFDDIREPQYNNLV